MNHSKEWKNERYRLTELICAIIGEAINDIQGKWGKVHLPRRAMEFILSAECESYCMGINYQIIKNKAIELYKKNCCRS